MKHVDFDGAVPFGKPKNWDDLRDGPCFTLPVLVQDRDHISRWTFTDEERQWIFRGADLHPNVLGMQPPVMLWLIDANPAPAVNEAAELPKRQPWWARVWEWEVWIMPFRRRT